MSSTGQDSDKQVSDLLATQDGISFKEFKAVLTGSNGKLTPDVRRALMLLIRHWFNGIGSMKVTHTDMDQILPAGGELVGVVAGHWSNGLGGLRDQDTDTMVMPNAGFDGLEKVASTNLCLHRMPIKNGYGPFVSEAVCRDHGVDPVGYSNRLFMLSRALTVVMAHKTIAFGAEVSQWTGEHLGDAP